ncbi:MAG: DUF1778 domain-containing protein [Cyanobacteria bacterium REEB65]|nr:DUF1778 domain-containing protein [Cyanobacteria bacterium REEB65]
MRLKDRRREVRLSARDDDVLAEAAGLAGCCVTEFLLDRALSDALALVESHHTVTLSAEKYRECLAALDAPSAPPPALVDQVAKARPLKVVD